jgi:hypothetical protein
MLKGATEYQAIISEFKNHLSAVLEGTTVTADTLMDELSKDDICSSALVSEVLMEGKIDLKSVFQEVLNKEINTLAILPCSRYVLDNLEIFKRNFKNIVLCDNLKKGKTLKGIHIIDQKEISLLTDEIDAYFIATGQPSLQQTFLPSAKKGKTVLYNEFAKKLVYNRTGMISMAEHISDRIRQARRPIIVLLGLYYPNVYTPTFKTLEKKGFDIFLLCRQPLATHAGFSSTIDKTAPFAEKYLIEFHDMLFLLKNLDKGLLWIIAETLYNCRWDGERVIASYAYPAALLRMSRIPCILNLYDVVRPLPMKTDTQKGAVKAYSQMLTNASGVILSSNTTETVNFINTSLEIKQSMISHFRYNFSANKLQPKRRDGFHIVMVGIFLDEHDDPARIGMSKYIKSLIKQKVHVHYYSDHQASKIFFDHLAVNEKPFFHIHASIIDQQELIYEISQYHAGWMIHRTQAFVDLMSGYDLQLLKDLIYMFHTTTVPSCALLFGNAGLPMFVNRSLSGLPKEFPPEFYIPIELSEIDNITAIIERLDWKRIFQKTLKQRELFSVEKNIGKLIEFIDCVAGSEYARDRFQRDAIRDAAAFG